MFEFINNIGPAVIAGLFGVIMWKLQAAESSRKESREKQNERMDRIEKSLDEMQDKAVKLSDLEKEIWCLSDVAEKLKSVGDVNGEGLKILMRYLLQRYHAEYMMQGFVTSHQRSDFLEAYSVYKAKGGNGTAEGWKNEVEQLSVRDDLPVVNPYLEFLKKEDAKNGQNV